MAPVKEGRFEYHLSGDRPCAGTAPTGRPGDPFDLQLKALLHLGWVPGTHPFAWATERLAQIVELEAQALAKDNADSELAGLREALDESAGLARERRAALEHLGWSGGDHPVAWAKDKALELANFEAHVRQEEAERAAADRKPLEAALDEANQRIEFMRRDVSICTTCGRATVTGDLATLRMRVEAWRVWAASKEPGILIAVMSDAQMWRAFDEGEAKARSTRCEEPALQRLVNQIRDTLKIKDGNSTIGAVKRVYDALQQATERCRLLETDRATALEHLAVWRGAFEVLGFNTHGNLRGAIPWAQVRAAEMRAAAEAATEIRALREALTIKEAQLDVADRDTADMDAVREALGVPADKPIIP